MRYEFACYMTFSFFLASLLYGSRSVPLYWLGVPDDSHVDEYRHVTPSLPLRCRTVPGAVGPRY